MERNLCVTLVIYQESLNDARSTKWGEKKKVYLVWQLHSCLSKMQLDPLKSTSVNFLAPVH